MVRGLRRTRLCLVYCLVACLMRNGPHGGSCDLFSGGASLRGRGLMASLLWRLRNSSFTERAVAKYSVLTSDDVPAQDHLLQKINMLGAGVQFFCQYVASLDNAHRAFVWGVTESTDAAQEFINKYFRARDLVGKGVVAGDTFLHIKYVLDGYVSLPVLEGFSRFIADQFDNFKIGFTVFASDVSEALLRHDTGSLVKIFREGLPLMTLCLKTLLALSNRTTDRQVREAKVTVIRGIDKLFSLDSTLLALSPNAPPGLLEARRGLVRRTFQFAKDMRNKGPSERRDSSGFVNDSP
ncbi:hypothetical protein BESB_070340 [Besnoitia besnoiti]|uniref:Uncharacterized protein n=1 Tax=Besnoitia besnoiti TaxID=94643 RepID=A0A2A9MER8_BESBE|nr:uncharacterized protein BESB_070340 [Besnoitia besnoiti]PFH33882.1 hypothetical protein BESB_070340 [Besnoitia besnoiti]